MNEQDLNLLKQFAAITLKYLDAYNEYECTALWQHLDNERKLFKRLMALYPIVDGIVNVPSNTKGGAR